MLPARWQLVQLLACLHKWLNAQEAEATCEREKASLERAAAVRIKNQLLAQIEMLRRAQTRGSNAKECHAHPSQSCMTNTAYSGATGGVADPYVHIARNALMAANIPSPQKLLASRTSWRLSGSGSRRTNHNIRWTRIFHPVDLSFFFVGGDHVSRFPKKFMILSFDCYTRVTDPIQHL